MKNKRNVTYSGPVPEFKEIDSTNKKPIEYIQLEGEHSIPTSLYNKLNYLGLIPNDVRKSNEGQSNYSTKTIQPWSIWLDYPELTSWDHDIIKRVLRVKEGDPRELDYKKIIHICNERLRQLKYNN